MALFTLGLVVELSFGRKGEDVLQKRSLFFLEAYYHKRL